MIIDKEQWEIFVKGFHVVDGAIGFNNTRYCFVLEETERNIHRDPPPLVRLLFVRMERPLERRFYSIDFPNFEFPRIAAATVNGENQFIAADMDGNVIVYDDVVAEIEPETSNIPTQWGQQQDTAVRKLRQVNGKLYAICGDRLILERRDYNKWLPLPGLPRPEARIADLLASNLPYGFNDIDAFSATDMYAAGGKGDVWQYNGAIGHPCSFPAEESLKTVCCAGNGKVYITSQQGSIWEGRADQWKKVATGTPVYSDIAWFDDKLWLAHDAGLDLLSDNGHLPADVPPGIHHTTRRLKRSEDGSLLLAVGQHGASVFDGREWQVLFNGLELQS